MVIIHAFIFRWLFKSGQYNTLLETILFNEYYIKRLRKLLSSRI